MKLAWTPLVAALALGCGAPERRPSPPPVVAAAPASASAPASPAAPAGYCKHALADYCGIDPCPTYEERLMAAHARRGVHRTGYCGTFRSVHTHDPFSGSDEWYDREGQLVGARDWVDYPRPCYTGGRHGFHEYGVVPECPP